MSVDAQPGRRIGRYLLEFRLGAGGMGQVFRAYDEVLHRRVALKLLLAAEDGAAPDPEAAERVRREARMAAALDHPNVVSIYDVGDHEGVAFIVMEFVLGQSMRSLIAGDAPVAQRIRWLLDVARALAAAHRAGLVHRDVKPENVMVRNDGVVKVLDFGIARRARDHDSSERAHAGPGASETEGLTPELRATIAGTIEDGGIAGTPGYMPPELIRSGRFDARSDEFAWGVLAFETLSGKLPWTRGDRAIAMCTATILDVPPPLGVAAPRVPETFAAVVDRSLAKDPSERFASMDALLSAAGAESGVSIVPAMRENVSDPVAHAPTAISGRDDALDRSAAPTVTASAALTAPPAIMARLAPRPAARLGARSIALALCAIFAGGSLVYRHFGGGEGRRHDSRASARAVFSIGQPRRITFDEGCEEFPTLSPDGRSVLFDAQDHADYHLYLLNTVTGERRQVTAGHGWQFAGMLSPDGTEAAYLSRVEGRESAYLVPLDGSAPPRLIADGMLRPSWTRDGRNVWAGSGTPAQRYDARTLAPNMTLEAAPGETVSRVLELPDRRLAARVEHTRRGVRTDLRLYRSDGRRSLLLWNEPSDEALESARDGSRLFVARQVSEAQSQLWQVPIDGTPPSPLPTQGMMVAKGLQIARDGRHVVWSDCGIHTGIARLVEPTSGTTLGLGATVPTRNWEDNDVVWIPGTSSLALRSDRVDVAVAWVVDLDGRAPARRLTHDEVVDLAVSADGALLAYSTPSLGVHVIRIDGTGTARTLTTGAMDRFPSFSRDGRSVYFERPTPNGLRVASVDLTGGPVSFVLDAGTGHPSAAHGANLLGYAAMQPDGATWLPRVRNLDTGTDVLLSSEIAPGMYGPIQFSPDAHRAGLTDYGRDVLEVDLASARIVGRFNSGEDQVTGMTMTPNGIVIARGTWSGDLWMADGRFE